MQRRCLGCEYSASIPAVCEGSGFYGAKDGTMDLNLAFAPNDTLGTWTIEATELASGLRTQYFIRLTEPPSAR